MYIHFNNLYGSIPLYDHENNDLHNDYIYDNDLDVEFT